MSIKSCNHTNGQITCLRSPSSLKLFLSEENSMKIVPKPTKRYLKKLELDYLYCPDCESQQIIRHGKSSIGTQRFMCKECNLQFVAQYDAIFPASTRIEIFTKEFFRREGHYWEWARIETLQMMESQVMRVHANKLIKANPIQSSSGYRVLLEFLVHEAYGRVMC